MIIKQENIRVNNYICSCALLFDNVQQQRENNTNELMMKQKVIFILLNEYTDWEGAFLSTALHVGVVPGSQIKYEVCTLSNKSAQLQI